MITIVYVILDKICLLSIIGFSKFNFNALIHCYGINFLLKYKPFDFIGILIKFFVRKMFDIIKTMTRVINETEF